MKLISLALLLFGASAAHAVCPATMPANVVCASWGASPGWNDGTGIAKPYAAGSVITYTVWLYANNAVVRSLGTTTTLDMTIRGLPAGSRCFVVTAAVTPLPDSSYSNPSANSNMTCKTVRFPGPSDGKIERPTDGSIEPK